MKESHIIKRKYDFIDYIVYYSNGETSDIKRYLGKAKPARLANIVRREINDPLATIKVVKQGKSTAKLAEDKFIELAEFFDDEQEN